MHATKHSRESASKGDDQVAFENGISCLEAVGLCKALALQPATSGECA